VSSRQGWKSSGVEVPVPSIACIQTVSISGACGGNDARFGPDVKALAALWLYALR
jgi:hypothetical protein